jgi:hypothetical protein
MCGVDQFLRDIARQVGQAHHEARLQEEPAVSSTEIDLVLRGGSKQRPGQDTRLADMGNRCESLINVVTIDMPKLLLGMTQNGMWPDIAVLPSNTSPLVPPAKRRALTQSCDGAGTW